MFINTSKTILGYLKSLVGKYTPLEFKAEGLDDIYNFLPISEHIYTSGQPTEEQFAVIKSNGFEKVINLAPHNAENSLKDEAGTLSRLGMQYTHIPVNFYKPRDQDFDKFKAAMTEHGDSKVWVHCAANMRVSAFMYRYRCSVLGESESAAREDLSKIWEPIGVWKKFIS